MLVPSVPEPQGYGNCCKSESTIYSYSSASDSARRYLCYRAVVAIVSQFYRPQHDGDELAARRTLIGALAQLQGAGTLC